MPYVSPKVRKLQKKGKKPDFSMFFVAIFLNVLTFALTQLSIENGASPQGDILTGFLYNVLAPGVANVAIFVFYTAIIFGLYLKARSSIRKLRRRQILATMSGYSSARLAQKQKSNRTLMACSTIWLLFTIMLTFHLMTFAGAINSIIR